MKTENYTNHFLEESIGITFIENSPVVFESINYR